MNTVDHQALENLAAECVKLVAERFGRKLDWSVESLAELDDAFASLLMDGPLTGTRLDLWWKLVGAYTGEVAIRAYGGQWVSHPNAPGAYAISVLGITGFPFATASRVLAGEPGKSLASFARVLPAIARRGQLSG